MQIVFALVRYLSLVTGLLLLGSLPVLVITQFFLDGLMVMVPLTDGNRRLMFPFGILTLPLGCLLFRPFSIKGSVLNPIRTNG
jgi:hypothetical protein